MLFSQLTLTHLQKDAMLLITLLSILVVQCIIYVIARDELQVLSFYFVQVKITLLFTDFISIIKSRYLASDLVY